MTEALLTLQQLAELEGASYLEIRSAFKKRKYAFVCYDDTQPLIRITDPGISDTARNKFFNMSTPATDDKVALSSRQEQVLQSPAPAPFFAAPEAAKKIALLRVDLIRLQDNYRGEHSDMKKTEADRSFIEAYNSGTLLPSLYKELGHVAVRTIYRWRDDLAGSYDWQLLVPRHFDRGAGMPELRPEEARVYLNLILSPNRIKPGSAYRLTRFALEKRGTPTDKSPATFRRYADWFKKHHYDRWVLMREGQKALRDKVEPFIKRDPSMLNVGDCLVADGHRLNFQIISPFTGRPCRATLVGYVDWKSYDLAGYEIMVEENTQCIASALRNAILRLGKFPTVSYQDNGKAFRARFFTGTDNLEEAGMYGLFGRLGIVPVFAQPYNARAKIIERWFKEFSDTFERLMPSFTGSSITDKPAWMMRNEKFHKALHKEYIPTVDETIYMIECWLEFHRAQPCPHVKGKTIGQVFNEGCGEGVQVNDLDDLMMDAKITNIRQNGIRFLNEDFYDDHLYGLREQVMIKYSLFDLSHVKVYSPHGEYLCTAQKVMRTHPLAGVMGSPKDMQEVKELIARQRRLEKQTIRLSKDYEQAGKTPELDWQKIVEVAPRVIEKLEKADIAVSSEDRHIPEEMIARERCDAPADIIQLTPPLRPIFNESSQRYEWHVRHGVFTQEDEAWMNWYQTTNEYQMLYGDQEESAG